MEMKKHKLGDIGEVRMCKRILKEETNTVSGIPFFKIGTFGDVADVFISRKKFEEYKAKYSYPKKGDVLISAAGTIGRTVVFNGEEAYFQDSNIVWIENDETKVVNALLYYAYKNVKWKVSNGSTILRLYNDDLRRTEIIVPADISVQKKIASVLSTLDKRIENLRAQNRVLEQTAKTIYDYTFLQCAGHQTTYNKTLNRNIPAEWEVKKLSEIANITMGQSPEGSSYNEIGNGKIFYQGCTDFGVMFPTPRLYTTAPTRFAKVNDILMSVRAPVGTLNIANTECCIGRGLAALNAKKGSNVFLYYVMKNFENHFKNAYSIGTTFGSITKNDLYDLPVLYPDSKTLNHFITQVSPLFKKQLVNSQQIEALTTQRNTLLPLLMTGQVAVK